MWTRQTLNRKESNDRTLRLHFGLGQASVVDAIEVRWPTTQKTEKFARIEANRFLTIKEDS